MTAPLHLLDEVSRVLREDLAPTLDGVERYRSLLTAKAVDIARRELDVARRLDPLEHGLPRSVMPFRDGTHDDNTALYQTLLDVSILRAHVADPSALTVDESDRLVTLRR